MSVLNTYKTLDSFVKIEKSFEKEMKRVEYYLQQMIEDQPKWFQEVLNHLVKAGGKRIRPLLVCLSYSLVSENKISEETLILAAISEFVHTATLFHDDVIDEGEERRGKPTVNKIYGNHTAVLSGDFILGRVFKELKRINSPLALSAMIDTVARLVEGEILQMDFKKRNIVNVSDYDELIYLKTASLFEWSMVSGGYASNTSDEIINLLQKMGYHIGRIFQIVDDILDYTGSNILGKKRLQDFYQGKITLPLLFLFETEKEYFYEWKTLISNNDEKGLTALSKKFTNRIKKPDIQNQMKSYLQKDIDSIKNIIEQLPNKTYHGHINGLIDFLVSRMI